MDKIIRNRHLFIAEWLFCSLLLFAIEAGGFLDSVKKAFKYLMVYFSPGFPWYSCACRCTLLYFSSAFILSPIYRTLMYFSTINRTFMCFYHNHCLFLFIFHLFLHWKSFLWDFIFMNESFHPISHSPKCPFPFSLSTYFRIWCWFLKEYLMLGFPEIL